MDSTHTIGSDQFTKHNSAQVGAECLAAALEYARLGWSSLPCCPPDHQGITWKHECQSPGKRPIVKWEPFETRLPTEQEIRHWWRSVPCNVGIALGPVSGLVRLDVDGADGETKLAELSGGILPITLEFSSGGGGRGLLFRIPDGVAIKTTKKKGEGVHAELRIQAKGAQTVLPPSLHVSGRRYAWAPGRGPGDVEAAPMPAWMIEAMRVDRTPDRPATRNGWPVCVPSGDDGAIALEALASLKPSRADDYDEWLNVGMALHSVDASDSMLSAWEQWSSSSSRFRDGACALKWRSFTPGGGLGIGSLVKWAKDDSGFKPRQRAGMNGHTAHTNGTHYDDPPCDPFDDVADHLDDAPPADPAEPEPGKDEHTPRGYRFNPMDTAAFMAGDFRPSWLVKRLLVRDQPCILGGPKKVLKTSLLIDLALSLGSGTPFLGTFDIYTKLRTVIISGESGPHTLQETARRVALAKGIDLAGADVLWDFRLPQLASIVELAELGRGLRDSGAKVAVIDPLYLTLLAGQGEQGLQASNLYDMGPLLMRVAETCLNAGATPILAHHAKRGRTTGANDPLELDDLAFAGVAEFARQWILVSRREPYEPGTGSHRLWLGAGGSIGHSGLWALDIDEGGLEDDFSGRRWDVQIATSAEVRQTQAQERGEKKTRAKTEQDGSDDAAILLMIDAIDPDRKGVSFNKVRDEGPLSKERATRAVARLLRDGFLEEISGFTVLSGMNYRKPARGIKRRSLA